MTQLRHETYGACMSQIESTGVVPPLTQGWRLQMALGHARMSVEQMAQELGVSRSTISRWLNDRSRPSRGYLRLWSALTGVDLAWLAGGEPPVPTFTAQNVHRSSDLTEDHDDQADGLSREDFHAARKRLRTTIPLDPNGRPRLHLLAVAA